ncbi:DUF6597 domain-containing transcriptional factor [Marinicrinis sediminis]|uniref:DUF6597 domain-containing transcriptional factor n=1 Tax=Marinicrinis sediminis TaxID=1652465 RepID=A0ABW5RA28_9BACL
MRYEERQPVADLQPYIQCLWHLDRTYTAEAEGERLWPDGCFELIFHYGHAYVYQGQRLPRAFVIGSLTRWHGLQATGRVRLFGVRMKPWGLALLFQMQVQDLKDVCFPMDEQEELNRNMQVKECEAKLAEAEVEEAFACLQTRLLQVLADRPPLQSSEAGMLASLSAMYEDPLVKDGQAMGRSSGYSVRHFERKCAQWTALTPKKLRMVARFNQVRMRIFREPSIDLHDCMHEFGYYDYAHFSKDFKECLGLTPLAYKEWLTGMISSFRKKDNHVAFLQDDSSPI